MRRRVEGDATEVTTRKAPEAAPAFAPTVVPAVLPTWKPDFDVAELAMKSLAFDSLANVPLDLAVPARVEGADLTGMPHVAMFLLMHVDGESPIATIAKTAQIPLGDVMRHFRLLLSRGIVEVGTRPSKGAAPPYSGVYRHRVDE